MKMVVGDRELEKEKIVLLVMHTLRSNEPVSVAGHGNDVPREDCVESVVVFVVMCSISYHILRALSSRRVRLCFHPVEWTASTPRRRYQEWTSWQCRNLKTPNSPANVFRLWDNRRRFVRWKRIGEESRRERESKEKWLLCCRSFQRRGVTETHGWCRTEGTGTRDHYMNWKQRWESIRRECRVPCR